MEETLDRARKSILSRNGKGTESERRAPWRKTAARKARKSTMETGKHRKSRGCKRGMEGWEEYVKMPSS